MTAKRPHALFHPPGCGNGRIGECVCGLAEHNEQYQQGLGDAEQSRIDADYGDPLLDRERPGDTGDDEPWLQ